MEWDEGQIRDVDELVKRIVDHFATQDTHSLAAVHTGAMSKEQFMSLVDALLDQLQITDENLRQKAKEVDQKYTWGDYILDELINDADDVSDIKVVAPDKIRIKRNGKRETANVKFKSKEDLNTFTQHIAVKNKIALSDSNAIQTFTDKDSNPNFILRFNIMTRYVTSEGTPYIHIRKIPKKKYTMDVLQKMGMFDEKTKQYLIKRVSESTGILFTGKGAAGKTTLMNAMLEEIPHDQSGMVIQENEELFTVSHPDLMFTHIVTNRGEGKIQYDLLDLAKNGLLVDLDYFIIGEIKGAEAAYFLNASYTGHNCWATVHGMSSTEAMDKLADYIKYGSDYSKEDALRMLHSINTVVYLENFKVKEISEVVGWDPERRNLKYKRIL